MYYENARSFQEATAVTVSRTADEVLDFVVEPLTRRRSARR